MHPSVHLLLRLLIPLTPPVHFLLQHTCLLEPPALILPESPGELIFDASTTAALGGANEEAFTRVITGLTALAALWGFDIFDGAAYLTPLWRPVSVDRNPHLCVTPPTTEIALLAARCGFHAPRPGHEGHTISVTVSLLWEYNTRVHRRQRRSVLDRLFPVLSSPLFIQKPQAPPSASRATPMRPLHIEEITETDDGHDTSAHSAHEGPSTSNKRPRSADPGSSGDSATSRMRRALNLTSQVHTSSLPSPFHMAISRKWASLTASLLPLSLPLAYILSSLASYCVP